MDASKYFWNCDLWGLWCSEALLVGLFTYSYFIQLNTFHFKSHQRPLKTLFHSKPFFIRKVWKQWKSKVSFPFPFWATQVVYKASLPGKISYCRIYCLGEMSKISPNIWIKNNCLCMYNPFWIFCPEILDWSTEFFGAKSKRLPNKIWGHTAPD